MSGELCLLRCAELCRESDTPTLRSWTRRQEVPCAILHRSIPFIVTIIRTILFFRHSLCRQDDPVTQFSLEGGFSYEAREIEASLKRKYEITE